MRGRSSVVVLVVVLGLLPLHGGRSVAEPSLPAHPRLLFDTAGRDALRQRAATVDVVASAAQRIVEKAEGHLLSVQPELVRPGEVPSPVPSQLTLAAYALQNEMPTYLIELGLAYQLTGDPRFGRRVVDLLLALGEAGYPFWSGQDLGIGDLLEGIGLGFDWSAELMTAAERRQIVASLWEHEALLFDRPLFNPANAFANDNPRSNWMGVTAGGAGLTLLAIRGEPGMPADGQAAYDRYLAAALERTRTYFLGSTDPLGSSHEGLTYAYYGLKNSVPFALAARNEGLGDLLAGTGLPNMARWIAFELLPGEGQNHVPLNDSQRSQHGADLPALLFAIAPEDGVAQWVWRRTAGELGTDYYAEPHVPERFVEQKCRRPLEAVSFAACPVFNLHGHVWVALFYRTPGETPEVDPATVGPLSVHYGQPGLVDARTGFAGEGAEVVSTFQALRDGYGHYHYDLGNFTLYGYGGRWAIDPGYACLACGETRDEGYAIRHNVIVVDGDKFTQHESMRYFEGPTIVSFRNAPNVSVTRADLRYAYSFQSPHAVRDHLFSRVPGRPVILAIGDALQRDASEAHAYTWQMLPDDGHVVVPDGPAFTVLAPNGARLAGRAAVDGSAAADPTVAVNPVVLTNPTDDLGTVVPLIQTTTPVQPAFDQLTVMALTPAGAEAATTETLRVTGGNAVAVTWGGVTDVVARRLHGAAAISGPIGTDGSLVRFTRGQGETVLRQGTTLASEGTTYVTVTGSPADVIVSGNAVQAWGVPGNTYRVLAPQDVTRVTVNDATVTSCRDGAELTFPCG